jgi:Na+/H+-dicarboxylate symporter
VIVFVETPTAIRDGHGTIIYCVIFIIVYYYIILYYIKCLNPKYLLRTTRELAACVFSAQTQNFAR